MTDIRTYFSTSGRRVHDSKLTLYFSQCTRGLQGWTIRGRIIVLPSWTASMSSVFRGKATAMAYECNRKGKIRISRMTRRCALRRQLMNHYHEDKMHISSPTAVPGHWCMRWRLSIAGKRNQKGHISSWLQEGAVYMPLPSIFIFESQKYINIIKMNLSQKIEVVQPLLMHFIVLFRTFYWGNACLSTIGYIPLNKMHKYYFELNDRY